MPLMQTSLKGAHVELWVVLPPGWYGSASADFTRPLPLLGAIFLGKAKFSSKGPLASLRAKPPPVPPPLSPPPPLLHSLRDMVIASSKSEPYSRLLAAFREATHSQTLLPGVVLSLGGTSSITRERCAELDVATGPLHVKESDSATRSCLTAGPSELWEFFYP